MQELFLRTRFFVYYSVIFVKTDPLSFRKRACFVIISLILKYLSLYLKHYLFL